MVLSPHPKKSEKSVRHDPGEDDLIPTLAGMNAGAEVRLAYRTRRLVHGALLNIRQRKSQSKRSLALIMLAMVAILVVLAPVIWNAVDHLIGEGHFGDVSTQMALLLLFALPALLTALLLMGILQDGNGSRRHL